MHTSNAFVLVHFGSNTKYLELELYAIRNLRDFTTQDIVYLYSEHDTPPAFVSAVAPLCSSVASYNDAGITHARPEHTSVYAHFNTLRTCNFMFAHTLTKYKKVCVVESDMIFRRNIDDIFSLRAPAVLTYFDNSRIDQNYRIAITPENINSDINGGVMLFSPSMEKFEEIKTALEIVIEKNCTYPNESLFLLSYPAIYHLPYAYNATMYFLIGVGKKLGIVDMAKYAAVVHMNCTTYKYIDYIHDDYVESLKRKNPPLYRVIREWEKKYYNKYKSVVDAEIVAASALHI
jgi:alpha-N-acetylglucosamine transferase